MKVCSSYCEFNESLIDGASEDTGLPRCVMETYPPAILLVLILFIGLVKYIQRKDRYKNVYRKFDSTEDTESGPVPNNEIPQDTRQRTVNRTNSVENGNLHISNPVKFVHGSDQMSFLFTFQQFLYVCLMIVPLIDIGTKEGTDSSRLQGVTFFYDAASLLLWLIGLLVLRYESIAFFKAKRSSHSLGMILFWGLAFVNENLSFISWNNKHWWFQYKTTIKQVELGLFITRYVCISLLFLLGLKAPGLYKPEPVLEVHERQGPSEAASVVSDRSGQSAFKDFWRKCKMLWPFLWPSNRLLQLKVVFCFILLALGRVVNVLIPYIYKLIVNKLTGEDNRKVVDPYALIGIYVVLKWLGTGNSGALNNLRTFVWIKIQQFTSRTLQVRLFEHLHSLSLRWHITRKTGEVITMVNRGSNSVYNLLNYILFNILPTIADITIAIVYFIVAFNGWFGLIVFVSMSAYLAATIIVTEWRTKFRRIMNIKDNDAKAKAVDSLLNFETVKYYAGEEFEVNRLNDAIVDYQDCEWQVLGSLAILNTAQNTIINLGLLVGAMYCGHLVVNGTLGVGDFVQFITYMVQLYVPLNFFGTYYRLIQQSFVDMENMFDLFSQGREVVDPPDAARLNVSNGLIEFKEVSFGYDPSKHVLKNISFKVYPGQTVALVGNSGGGKSTVIRLLYRFYDVLEGSISIDGQDVTKVTQKSLRSTIGVVPQDTVLFNNNIRYNIRYGRLDSADEEVEEAAMAADIHSRILTFPQQYNTLVGERGLKLSGGEKQRVAIARTVLKNPPIVLLDEATSALDTKTERNIQASLNNMCINRTTIVVAHRLSTIVNADQILVLNEGEIVERGRNNPTVFLSRSKTPGMSRFVYLARNVSCVSVLLQQSVAETHEELLALEGYYANMWQQQSRKNEKKKEDADENDDDEEDEEDDDDDDDVSDSDDENKDTGKEKTS